MEAWDVHTTLGPSWGTARRSILQKHCWVALSVFLPDRQSSGFSGTVRYLLKFFMDMLLSCWWLIYGQKKLKLLTISYRTLDIRSPSCSTLSLSSRDGNPCNPA